MARILRPKKIEVWYNEQEREAWDEDAHLLGFATCGGPYIRHLLELRAKRRLMILDPTAMEVWQMVGKFMGAEAGEILARVQRAYLEGGR